MAEPDLSLLGGGPASQPVQSAEPQQNVDTSGGDPAVWTVLGEAGTDPQGQVAVGSTLLNRMRNSKASSLGAVATDPSNGYEAWQNANDRARTVTQYPVGSPQYAAAQKTLADLQSGAVAPLPYDSFYSPKGQAALGRKPPSFENGTGVDIGGNRFFTTGAAGDNEPDLTALGGAAPAAASTTTPAPTPSPVASSPVLDRVAADIAQAQMTQSSASGKAQWPIYDEANNVGRNKDGSIAYVGRPTPIPAQTAGAPIELNVAASSNPTAISDWMAAHPLDPSNGPQTTAGAQPQQTSLGRAGVGAEQGLANVSNSLIGMQNAVRSNPFGNALMTGATGQIVTPQEMQADLASGVMNRNANDITLGSSPAYQMGKFGGESAASLPLMAGGEGLLGAGMGAIAPDLAGGLAAASGANRLFQLPERLAGSALTGARYGAEGAGLTSAGSSRPLADQMAQGAAMGAVINPLFGVAGAGARAAGSFLRPIVEPWLPGGASAIADRNLTTMAQGNPLDLTEYVPGSKPTFAQALPSDNMAAKTNAAVQERQLSSKPGTNAPLAQTLSDADRARAAEVEDLTAGSDPAMVARMKASRDAATDQLRSQAFANTSAVDPTPVIARIDQMLADPSIADRDVVTAALRKVRAKLVTGPAPEPTPAAPGPAILSGGDVPGGGSASQLPQPPSPTPSPYGTLQTDPERLYGVRQSIDDQLSPLSDEKGPLLARNQLRQIQQALDPVIESGAPGYRQYMQTYAAASKPINGLEYLQSLNLGPAGGGPPTLARVNRAAAAMTSDLNAPGLQDAKSLSPEQVQRVYNLQADLQRAGSTGPALGYAARGKQITGNTNGEDWLNHPVANLAADAVGAIHPAAGFALAGAKSAAQGGNARVLQATANKLANPETILAPRNVPVVSPNKLIPGSILGAGGIVAGKNPPGNRLQPAF